MKKRFLLTSFTFAILLGLCFGTTMATNLFRPIRAAINQNYNYFLDGKPILKGKPALIYQGTIYAPLSDLATTLGYNVATQEDGSTLTTPNAKPTKPSNVTIDRAVITAINFASNRVTVYPIGQPNNQIDLLVTPSTVIKYSGTGTPASITDLNTNLSVKVVHSPNVTKSNPPQATAVSITIISPSTPIQPR